MTVAFRKASVQQQKAHPRVEACSVFTLAGHGCGYSPSSETHRFFWSYEAQVDRLAQVFPRGRFKRDADGTAILVPRSGLWAGCHLYEQAPGRLVGLCYAGAPRKVTNRVGAYVVKHLGGDGEGVFHLRWDSGLAKRLPTFSRSSRAATRTSFKPAIQGVPPDLGVPGAENPPHPAQDKGTGP